jgi:periplasmic protein CpxP/Spy
MQTPQTPVAAQKPSLTPPQTPPRSRRWFASVVTLGGLGWVTNQAQAQGFGHGRGHLGTDPQEMARKLDYRMGYLIKEINGTPQQKDQLVAIATRTLADLKPLRDQHMQARKQGLTLLAAPAIDGNALEQLRLAQLKLADASSSRLLQAMAAAAEVLTPPQRAELAARMQQRMAHRQSRG